MSNPAATKRWFDRKRKLGLCLHCPSKAEARKCLCRRCRIRSKLYHAQPHVRLRGWVRSIWRRFDVTVEWFLEHSQNGCESCGSKDGIIRKSDGRKYRLCVDHDHQTGKARGILCSPCNRALGYLGDDATRIRGLLRYIRRVSR